MSAGITVKRATRIAAILAVCLGGLRITAPYAWSQSSDQDIPSPTAPAVIPGETEPPPPMPLPPDGSAPNYYVGATLTDPAAVSACLCGRQRVNELNRQVMESKKRFDGEQAALQEMQRSLDEARGHIDVDNIDQVNAFRRLSMRKEMASGQFFGRTQPAHIAKIRQYNEAVAGYNRQCAGHGLAPETVTAVQTGLICQSPELPAQ